MNKFNYFKFPNSIDMTIAKLRTKDPGYWERKGEERIIKFANYVTGNVPAYRDFLSDKNIKIKKIDNINYFKKLPLTGKNLYLKKYEYIDLFAKGGLDEITTISSTSGSTGHPFYFPRGEEQDSQYEFIAEVFLKNQFELDKKRTLAINGFGLGIWIGGIFTYKNLNKIASKGYRLAVAPVGTNKDIFLKTFKKNDGLFEQFIVMGYPPFIKDIRSEEHTSELQS